MRKKHMQAWLKLFQIISDKYILSELRFLICWKKNSLLNRVKRLNFAIVKKV